MTKVVFFAFSAEPVCFMHAILNALDLEELSVDTGIEDFAKNHDHYLYGTAKRS